MRAWKAWRCYKHPLYLQKRLQFSEPFSEVGILISVSQMRQQGSWGKVAFPGSQPTAREVLCAPHQVQDREYISCQDDVYLNLPIDDYIDCVIFWYAALCFRLFSFVGFISFKRKPM